VTFVQQQQQQQQQRFLFDTVIEGIIVTIFVMDAGKLRSLVMIETHTFQLTKVGWLFHSQQRRLSYLSHCN